VAGKIENLKPFTKGDPRINRKGRPKSFDELRALAQKIAHERFIDKNGDPVVFPGRKSAASKAEAILLQWSQSNDPRKQALFIEYAYGKVPQKSELTGAGGGPIKTEALGIDWVPCPGDNEKS